MIPKTNRNEEIYRRRMNGEKGVALAKEFGISEKRIGVIVKTEDWKKQQAPAYARLEEIAKEIKKLKQTRQKLLAEVKKINPRIQELNQERTRMYQNWRTLHAPI